MKRWTALGLVLAGGMLAACSSGGGGGGGGADASVGTDTSIATGDTGGGTPDTPTGDRGRDAGPADTGPATRCGPLAFTNLNTTGMRSGSTTRTTGDTTMAWTMQTAGAPPTGRSPISAPSGSRTCTAMTGQIVYQYTIGAAPASLRVSTTNMVTPRNFDTVLWVTTRCANTLTAAACNDDDPEFAGSADRRVSSLVVTETLPAGTTVYVILGGFYPPGTGTIDHGRFELTVSEEVPVAMGGACRVDGRGLRCATGLSCVGADLSAEMGVCRTTGSLAGSGCRTSTPECDGTLTCNRGADGTGAGVCVNTATVGGRCNPYNVCPEGSNCISGVLGSFEGTCVRVGTAAGTECRPMGAAMGRCDMGFACSADLDPDDATPTCERPAMAGGPCAIGVGALACPSGSTCVTVSGGAIGTCRPNGTVARTACRPAGMASRCDAGLMCLRQGDGAAERCVTVATVGGGCDEATYCPDGSTCYLTDLSNRSVGRCGGMGMAGGACGDMGVCAGATMCSSMAGTGLCQTVVMEGMPCVRPISRCADGLTCVLNANSQTDGLCRRDGTAAGSECRNMSPECDMGLTCAGSFLSGGVCQRTATAGMACDPLHGTTRCPMGQVCRATAFNAGTCVAPTGAEMEPNNSPMAVMARATTMPVAQTGALPFGDVDCVAVTVPAMGRIVASVSDGQGRCPAPFQGGIVLDMYDTNGTTLRGVVTRTGPFGLSSCATIDGGRAQVHAFAGNLAAGTYFVCARGLRDANTTTGPIASYVLTVTPSAGM